MAKKTETTVEEKLRSLFDLQLIDSRVDEIRNVRGELPLEVQDLEDEVAGMTSLVSFDEMQLFEETREDENGAVFEEEVLETQDERNEGKESRFQGHRFGRVCLYFEFKL